MSRIAGSAIRRSQQDALALLIVKGFKTATCSALIRYQEKLDTLPHPGDRFIVENGQGEQVCLIETIDVQLIRFCDVDNKFAYDEGKDDRSLAAWQKEHRRFFENEGCFSPDMMLICE